MMLYIIIYLLYFIIQILFSFSQSFNNKCLVLQENSTLDSFGSDVIDMRSGEIRYRHYYIAAEEITWDYGIRKPHQLIRPRL